MRVYLAGKILKGEEIGQYPDWRIEFMAIINQIPNLQILSPEDSIIDESRPELIFGYDCYLIKNSDLIVVNATSKLGVGTAQEMLIAKFFNKPVITVLPPNSHHRRRNLEIQSNIITDWIHPFVYMTSDVMIDGLDQLAEWIIKYYEVPSAIEIKGIEIIEETIKQFQLYQNRVSIDGA